MFLEQNIVEPYLIIKPGAQTSHKPAASKFPSLSNCTVHPPTKLAFDGLFGPLWLDDNTRISQTVVVQPPNEREMVQSEADATRLFHKQVSGIVMPYFGAMPLALERDQVGPVGTTSFSGTVDTQFIQASTNKPLAVVELKAPGIIESDWSQTGQSSGTQRLGQELRMYMYEYECPQGACYDGKTMLIVRLRARNREDIRTCNGDMFVIPNIAGPGGIHIRYALYRLSVDGLHRNMAAIAPPVSIGIYTRNFDWFNSNPYWTAAGSNTRYNEVTGVVRNPKENTQTGKVQWAWWNHGVSVAWCSDFF